LLFEPVSVTIIIHSHLWCCMWHKLLDIPSQLTMWQSKSSLNMSSERLSTSHYGISKFSTERLADCLNMPSVKCHSTTHKVIGLIFFSFLTLLSTFWHTTVCTVHFHGLTSVFHSSLLTAKSVDLVVASFACIMEIVHIFHSGYLDY